MEAVIPSKDCNIESYNEALYPSKVLPPSYLDILVEKCLKYHEKVFGRCAKEEIKEIIDFLQSGMAPLTFGARASRIREFPIHGYVEPTVPHSLPNIRKLMIFMCQDWPGIRLVPEPATFGSFLYTDKWSPPCSIHSRTQGN